MNPSPQAVAAIRAKVADWSPSDASITAALNSPSVSNPVAQATVAKPFAVQDIFGAVAPASLAKLTNVAFVPDIRDKVQSNDRAGCGLYANLLMAGGVLTQADHDAVMAVLAATEPDPLWQSQISWAVATIGRPVDSNDIAASRPGA